MREVTGNLPGHLLPGLLLLFWSFAWIRALLRDAGTTEPQPLERYRAVWIVKILLGPIGIAVHIPPASWSAMSKAMAWQHASMFVGFALSGVIDLLVERGRLGARASIIAFTAAMGLAALLLLGHGNPGGLESTSHVLLALSFVGCAATGVLELLQPTPMARWLRAGALLLAALWTLTISWVLFSSGWELGDANRVMWLYTLFAVDVFAAGAILTCAALLTHPTNSNPAVTKS